MTKWKLKHALRRQKQWVRDIPYIAPWGMRHASNSAKRWNDAEHEAKGAGKTTIENPSEDDYELSPRELRWKTRMRDMKERIDADPYEAIFGRRFTPFYASFLPNWMRADLGLDPDSHKSESKGQQSPGKARKEGQMGNFMQDFLSPERLEPSLARASSFRMSASQQAGASSVIKASASSWDSASNQVRRSVYDPISGRMVEAKTPEADAAETSDTATFKPLGTTDDRPVNIPVKTYKEPKATATQPSKTSYAKPAALSKLPTDDLDFLTPENVRASMGKTKRSVAPDRRSGTQSAKLVNDYEAGNDSVDKDIADARRTLAEYQTKPSKTEQKPEAGDQAERVKSLIARLEQALHEARLSLANSEEDAIQVHKRRRAESAKQKLDAEIATQMALMQANVDDYPTEPIGLQTSFLKERASGRPQDFEGDLGGAHEEVYDTTYPTAPVGLQSSFEKEKKDGKSLEAELQEREAPQEIEDGYSKEPVGLQASYEKERLAVEEGKRGCLADELQSREKAEELEDGYSKEPIGMQASYEKERQAVETGERSRLEEELQSREKAQEHEDGYSKEPIGMQASYENERKAAERDGKGLADELRTRESAETHDDGYSTRPIGLQSSYTQERQGGQSLEAELKKREAPVVHSDGYSTEPIGLQASYRQERQAPDTSLEEELKSRELPEARDDGYSTKPVGLQASYLREREGGQSLEAELKRRETPVANHDGYSMEPIGLQASYRQERQSNALSLEEELRARELPEVREDGYSTKPIGLQASYLQERQGGQTLEEELKKREMPVVLKDGYSIEPIGLQASFDRERQHGRSLEAELQNREKPVMHRDGYSTEPIGLQASFSKERQQGQSLEAELKDRETPEVWDDGYSSNPIGLQASYNSEIQASRDGRRQTLEKEIQAQQDATPEMDDGYSKAPIGLQASFRKEREGKQPLEQELQQKEEVAPQYDDGYSTASTGLQSSFQKERQAASRGDQQSLEEEIQQQSEAGPVYEDGGYTTAPFGLQSSFAKEQVEQQSGKQPSLEQRLKDMQGEGDVDANAALFADRPVYKQPAALQALRQQLVQNAEELTDDTQGRVDELVHRALAEHDERVKTQPAEAPSPLPEDPLHKYLAEHDGKLGEGGYRYKDDGLEIELKWKSDAAAKAQKEALNAASTAQSSRPSDAATAQPASAASIEWAEPATYTVVAYNSETKELSTATTTDRVSEFEQPMGLAKALTKLYYPGAFAVQFTKLAGQGWQAVFAEDEVAVFRKVKDVDGSSSSANATTADTEIVESSKSTEQDVKGVNQQSSAGIVNPIDGTAKRGYATYVAADEDIYAPPPTGNYASPTGFVNHDPIVPFPASFVSSTHENVSATAAAADGIAKVRREEQVFSGSRRKWGKDRDGRRGHKGRTERRRWRQRVKWVLSVGAGTAVGCYVVGVASEIARQRREGN